MGNDSGRDTDPSHRDLCAYLPPVVRDHVAASGTAFGPVRFRAAALFADVAGFTGMAETFSQTGAAGAEELTGLLNRFFGWAVATVEDSGGQVGTFGGDAISAVFFGPSNEVCAQRATQAAMQLQASMGRFAELETSRGTFSLACKIGVSVGTIEMGAVAPLAATAAWWIAGEAVDRAAEAEHHGGPGEVVLDRAAADAIDAHGVRRDRYLVATPSPGPDELPTIAHSIGGVASEVAIDELLRFIHPAVAARLHEGLREFLSEHRRIVAIFAGFGTVEIDGPAADDTTRTIAGVSSELAASFDGYLHQIDAGDKGLKVIVIFGAPVAHEDDEERAARFAVALRDHASLPPSSIGVAAGVAFCGEVGGPTRRAYTMIGDTMNVAARLMQGAEPGHVLCTDTFGSGAPAVIESVPAGRLSVKGRAAPVDVLRIDSVRVGSTRFGERRFTSPLHGRDDELARLLAAADRTRSGRGGSVVVEGDPGLGKSRLVAEAAAAAAARGATILVGACSAMGAVAPFLPWRTIVTTLVGGDPSTTDHHALAGLLVTAAGERAGLLAPLVGLSGFGPEGDIDDELGAEVRTSLVVDLIRRRASQGLVWLLVEDAYRADPASRDLLTALARATTSDKVLIVATTRPTTEIARNSSPQHWLPTPSIIHLEPLSEAAMRALLDHAAHAELGLKASDTGALADLLLPAAHGNPFFLEELIAYCRDRGIDGASPETSATSGIPDSLQRLVLSRLDVLTPGEQGTLRVASVIGRRFPEAWIWGAHPSVGSPDTVARHAARLDETGLIDLIRGGEQREHLFRHTIVHEATYATLSDGTRRQVHGEVGRYLERSFASDHSSVVDSLAFHFDRTDDLDRRRYWLRRAAEAAASSWANEAAAGYYERLLPLVPDDEAPDLYRALGESREHLGHWVKAEEAFRASGEHAVRVDDEIASARARVALGYLLAHTHPAREAVEHLRSAVAATESSGDEEWTRRGLEYLGFAAWQLGDFDASIDASKRLLERSDAANDPVGKGMAYQNLGMVYGSTGALTEAADAYESAIELAERADDTRGLIHALNDRAGLEVQRGDLEAAVVWLRRALEEARGIGYRHLEGMLIGNAGELYREHGQLEEARAYTLLGLAIVGPLRDLPDIITRLGNLALILDEEGDVERAQISFRQALELADSIGDAYTAAIYRAYRARLHARLGRIEEARSDAEEAERLGVKHGFRDVVIRAIVESIRLRVDADELRPAQALVALDALVAEGSTLSEQALVAYESWRLEPTDPRRLAGAIEALEMAFASMPNPEHRRRLEDTTGCPAQPRDPLPPLATLSRSTGAPTPALSVDEALAFGDTVIAEALAATSSG